MYCPGSPRLRIPFRCLTVGLSSPLKTQPIHHEAAKSEPDLPEWQTAIEALMLCSRGGDPLLARIGVMKALNRGVERVFNSDRKETHWGKRKLKRDQ